MSMPELNQKQQQEMQELTDRAMEQMATRRLKALKDAEEHIGSYAKYELLTDVEHSRFVVELAAFLSGDRRTMPDVPQPG